MSRPRTPAAAAETWWRVFLALCLAGLAARQIWWLLYGYLNCDEFENLHVIWLWERGIWPARDYYHTRTLVYNLLLYPLYRLLGPRAGLVEAVRWMLLPLWLLTLGLLWRLAARGDRRGTAGPLAVTLLLASPTVGLGLTEARADAVALPALLGAMLIVLRWGQRGALRLRDLALAGLLCGLSLSLTQKGAYVVLILAWLVERHARRGLALGVGERVRAVAAFGAPALVPFAAIVGEHLRRGWLDRTALTILMGNFLGNVDLPRALLHKQAVIAEFAPAMTAVLALAALGVWRSRFWRLANGLRDGAATPALAAAGLCGGVLVCATPFLVHHYLVLPFVFVAGLAAQQLARIDRRLAAVVVVLTLVAGQAAGWTRFCRRDQQMATFRWVLAHTREDQPVLQVMWGFGAFRPIVGRMLHYRPGHLGGELLDRQSQAVEAALRERRFGAVENDDLLRFAPASVRSTMRQNYQPAREASVILIPKPDGP